MRRKPGLGLARDGSVGKVGWGYVRSFGLVFVLDFPFGHLRTAPCRPFTFPLGRNESKWDDGCGGRPVAHPSAPIRAIMQVSPNERRYRHSNAEPQGRLLAK